MSLFDRLKEGLKKTRDALASALPLAKPVDAAALAALESSLLGADLGAQATERILAKVGKSAADPRTAIKEELAAMLTLKEAQPWTGSTPLAIPEVTLVIGVNGSGKTTSTGKLAMAWTTLGQKVMLAAGDTFRAAAVEQLRLWAGKCGAEFHSQGQDADPASVAYDAISRAKSLGLDRVLIDTAGRLQTKSNLMEELSKVRRVCAKALPGAPHRVLLVLDGTTGQNMVSQARLFHEACPVTGIAVTKLDGTAKAGALVQVVSLLKVPVAFIGVGEKPEDLQPFDPAAFASALVDA